MDVLPVLVPAKGTRMFTVFSDGQRTELNDLTDVLSLAQVDDPVYVPTRGWMLVGDLRLNMMPGWADLPPTAGLG